MRLAPHLRVFSLAVCCAGLVSCQNGAGSSQGSGSSPYVSNFGSDGGYNPYPGQPGYVSNDSGGSGQYVPPPSYSTPPTYTPPPPPQQAADPYAFSAPSRSSSSSASGSSAPRSSTTASTKPKPKPKAAATSTAKKSSSSGSGSYKVEAGDTLYGIARKRGTTVAKLKAANKLSSDLIRPGQSLRIP